MLRREAKLGCEATFSPDLNLCHLDSRLAGGNVGDGGGSVSRPESKEGLRGARPGRCWGLLPVPPWLPVSVVQDQDFPHSAKVGNFSELVGGPEG